MPDLPRSVRLNRDFWDRISDEYQEENRRDLEGTVRWGPSMPPEERLRVLGDVAGKDVLDLCCGGGQTCVALARQGARVTGVDVSSRQLAHARRLAEREGAAVRLVEAPVSDLSMLPDASFDVALSAYALGYVEDVAGAFREAHRLLRPGGLLAFSWASPLFECTSLTLENMLLVSRPYYDTAPQTVLDDEGATVEYPRTYGDWLRALVSASFVVTDILEPRPEPRESTWSSHPLAKIELVPGTTIWKARKPAA